MRRGSRFARPRARGADWPGPGAAMSTTILLSALLLAAIALPVLWLHRKRVRRRRTLVQLLDSADLLEALLDRSQERMRSLRPLMQRVPADIAAGANASIDGSLPGLEAKRDLLQHRLWIQQHADTASQAELDQACAAMSRVRARLGGQLSELETVRSDLKLA